MLAFLFPGQGLQRSGVGKAWTGEPEWEVVESLSRASGVDVARLLLEAQDDDLRQTLNSQLVALGFSLLVFHRFSAAGVRPDYMAGHSVGEFAALAAAGALGVGGVARVVSARGRAMQAACERVHGTMRACQGLGAEEADSACALARGDVWVAGYNAPDQTVISGTEAAVEAADHHARRLGARRSIPLRVGGAFHTPFMRPASDELSAALDRECLAAPTVPVVANVDAHTHTEAAPWRSLLSAQLCAPVRWWQSIERLATQGVDTFVTIDPGRTLASLVARTCPAADVYRGASPRETDEIVERLVVENEARRSQPLGAWEAEEYVLRSPIAGSLAAEEKAGVGTESGILVREGEAIANVSGTVLRSPCNGWLLDDTTPGAWVGAGDPVYRVRAHSASRTEESPV